MGETVTLSADSRGIARIAIARPERKNAFDAALIAEITAAVATADRDDGITGQAKPVTIIWWLGGR